jgi:D-glycero-alpha-D-manno-heptose 1-phosphate guanylyltransferase
MSYFILPEPDKTVTALILAGGLGSRLRTIVADHPKVLAPVAGRPFLTYLLDQLITTGFRQVVLCTGYKGKQVKTTFGNTYNDLAIQYSQEPEPLGTGGALHFALPMIHTKSVMVFNGDSYVKSKLQEFLAWYFEKKPPAALLLARLPDTRRYGQVEFDANGRVVCFEEKGARLGSGWINAGVYLFNRSLIESIPAGKPISLETDVFPGLIAKGLYGFRCEDEFIDIGTPESYAEADGFFKKT